MEVGVERMAWWRNDPVQFVRDNFGVEPQLWQADVLRDYAKPGRGRIAMQACAGPGKTACLAWIGWHFLSCTYDPNLSAAKKPIGLAISISGDNLEIGLWKELSVWRDVSPFLTREFRWTATKVYHKDHPEKWGIWARTYVKSANPETQGNVLSGLHSPWIIYLLDEIGDMHPIVTRRADQGLVDQESHFAKIVGAGNPTSTTGLLYDAVANQADRWTVHRITGDPDDPRRSPRIDLEEARALIARYGREDPWVQAYILGQFPPGGLNTLLSPDEVREAMQRTYQPAEYEWAQKRLGIDVARFGDDRTVIFPRQGIAAFRPQVMRGQRTTTIAGRALVAATTWGSEMEFIDDTGHWGHGVVDGLIAAGRPAIPVIFSDPAIDPRYGNRRAEMLFLMSEWVKRGGALPHIPEMIAELTTPTYTLKQGKVYVEEKDMIKKRLLRSPDLADALALTFAIPDMPGAQTLTGTAAPETLQAALEHLTTEHVVRDYDPFDPKRMTW